jgi:AAA+ superfamily predicted ATPase
LGGEAGVPLFRVPAPELAGTSAADAARRVRLLFDRAAAEVAARTPGLVGAELAALLNEAVCSRPAASTPR